MAGASKKRAKQEASGRANTSSSGAPSSIGQPTESVQSSSPSASGSAPGGYDGNRDPEPSGSDRPRMGDVEWKPKNFDLGMAGWNTVRGLDTAGDMPARPAPSKLGSEVVVGLNAFDVESLPTADVYQFDVVIGSGTEKRGLNLAAWQSQAVVKELGTGFIYDGNKIAWSLKPIDREKRVMVDLDKEKGKAPRVAKPGEKPPPSNVHRVVIRQTNRIRMDVLHAYLNGQCSFDNACLESINFLDHLLREWPSQQYTQIKRSYFRRGEARTPLGGGIEAFKGVYQSMRIVHNGAPGKARLSVIADVANGTFWTEGTLSNAALQLTGKRDMNDLVASFQRGGEKSNAGQAMKRLRKIRVIASHRGGSQDEYVVERFVYQSARSYAFEKDGKKMTLYDYFASTYKIRLQYPDLPLAKMTKGKNTVLPMEVLKVKGNQRYPFKMDEKQTANMIKFAVTYPRERWAAINQGLQMLDWPNDPVLRAYGLKISPKMKQTPARLIPAPKVQFDKADTKPGTSGRWDLRGKKFLTANSAPLKSWSVCVIPGRRGGKPDKTVVEGFIKNFINVYQSHGGRVENKQPSMLVAQSDDVGSWVTAAWNSAGNQTQTRPQMLVFILPDKDSMVYGRIKRSAECRYGVVSQCMQYAHVQKGSPQYISNVCMKFNAKLGGSTARAIGPKSGGPTGMFSTPTVVFGADVSHASPGAVTPSMAALTMSTDKLGIRYAANCETNGYRVEMITTDNITKLMKPMLQYWIQNIGGGQFPKRLFYFRDGVSEAQYKHVLDQEVSDMKNLIRSASAAAAANIQFVVVVGSKRHNIRFFPQKGGDKNGNPLPGTLVETAVTHPFENDFYLNSHAAIKGTARPMHYHVLLNEAKMSNEELQTLIYEQCYQYVRATTPVSQHPAIYYAHIASGRAAPHDPKWGNSSEGNPQVPQPGAPQRSGSQSGSHGRSGSRPAAPRPTTTSSGGPPPDADPLLPMQNQGGIHNSMWFI